MNKPLMTCLLCALSSSGWAADSTQAVSNAGNNTGPLATPIKVLGRADSARGAVQTAGKLSGASGTAVSVGAAVSVGVAVSAGASRGSAATPGGASGVAATTPDGKPLTVTDETITVAPPNEALQKKPDTQLEGKPDKAAPAHP